MICACRPFKRPRPAEEHNGKQDPGERVVRSRLDPQSASDDTMADAAVTPAGDADECISKPDLPSGSTPQPNGNSPVPTVRKQLYDVNGTSHQRIGNSQAIGMSSEAAAANGHGLHSSANGSNTYQHAELPVSAADDGAQPGTKQVQGSVASSETTLGGADSQQGAGIAAQHSAANGDAWHSNGLKRMSWMEETPLFDSVTLERPHTASNGHAGHESQANGGAVGSADEDSTGDAQCVASLSVSDHIHASGPQQNSHAARHHYD